MKRIVLALVILGLVGTAPVFAGDWAVPKKLSAEVGADLGSFGIGAAAGVEYGMLTWKIAPQFNLNVGAKALVSAYVGSSFGFNVAAFGTLHYNFMQLNTEVEFFDKLEYFMGLGVGIMSPFVTGNAGFSYDLSKDMAIIVQNEGYSGGIVGIKVRL